MSLATSVARSLLRPGATVRYGDDRSQVAELHLPRGAGPHPVVVLLHGGYWGTRYGKLVMRPLALDLARRGIAAWNVEYRRLGPGRGGGGGWPMTFEDVGGAIDALAGVRDLDLGAVDVVGHSAGGQLALWAAGRASLPAGAVGTEPQVTVRRVVGLAPVTDLRAAGRAAHALVGGAPGELPDRWAQADPLARAPLDVPTLLVHPADDTTVPVARSRAYARAGGGAVELVVPQAGGHTAPIDPGHESWHIAVEWLTT